MTLVWIELNVVIFHIFKIAYLLVLDIIWRKYMLLRLLLKLFNLTVVWTLLSCLVICQINKTPMQNKVNVLPSPSPNLQFSLKKISLNYCSQSLASLDLELVFNNSSQIPIILFRDSKTWLSYKIIKLNANQNEKKEREIRRILNIGKILNLEEEPKLEQFVILSNKQEFRLKGGLYIYLYDGSEDTEGDLQNGQYELEVKLLTWYFHPYFVDDYRKKWSETGYLWSDTLTSTRLPFEIHKNRIITSCPED